MKKTKKYIFNDIEYDSQEEVDFAKWIEESKLNGLIESSIYHPESLILTERKTIPDTVQLKTKTKSIEKFLLHPLTYQVDWEIVFTNKFQIVFPSHGLLSFNDRIYLIDVKGAYNLRNVHRIFIMQQKLVYDKYGMYVNMVVPEKFFAKTFVPSTAYYMKSRKVLTVRKPYSKCKLISEFNLISN